MNTYRYKLTVFNLEGAYYHQISELSAEDLYRITSQVGRTTFLELINRWNRVTLLQEVPRKVVYLYTAMYEGED